MYIFQHVSCRPEPVVFDALSCMKAVLNAVLRFPQSFSVIAEVAYEQAHGEGIVGLQGRRCIL